MIRERVDHSRRRARRPARVRIIATNRRRQSVARNTGAAVAAGRYLLFLDDDDWLATGALASLLKPMLSGSSFVVSYGGALLRRYNRPGDRTY